MKPMSDEQEERPDPEPEKDQDIFIPRPTERPDLNSDERKERPRS
jgi:hypothetical protein